MKPIIFASFLLCLALTARAQQNLQIDSTPTPGQWVRLNSGTTQTLGIVSYPSIDTIVVSGGATLRSTNGGTSWLPFPNPGEEGFFFSSSQGLMFGSSGITYVTHDAGQTWDTGTTTGITPINTFCWASPDTCFVVGGGISRSTDGGLTWTMTPGSAYNELWSTFGGVSFCNTQVGYATGPEIYGLFPHQNDLAGECFKTTDGGVHWNALWTGIAQNLGSVVAINPDTVLVLGQKGIYQTTDGGNTWDGQTALFTFPNNAGAEAFTMRGNSGFVVGAVLGSKGYIIHTTDWGTTWTQESDSTTPGYLYSVSMLNDTDAIAVGDNGAIIKRTSGTSGVIPQGDIDSIPVQVFPNPSQQLVSISYSLLVSQQVTLVISNALGQVVATPLQGVLQSSGLQSVPISTSNFASGTYFLQLTSENYSSTLSFTVIQ